MSAGPPTKSGQREADEPVEDVDDLIRRSRIEQILNKRQEATELYTHIRDAVQSGDVTELRGRRAYHQFLQGYIVTLEPLMKKTFEEIGEEYLTVDLGTVVVLPPNDMDGDMIVREITGLEDILEFDPQTTADFSDEKRAFGSMLELSETVEVALSWDILLNATRKCNEFVSEIGLDLDQGNDRPFANY